MIGDMQDFHEAERGASVIPPGEEQFELEGSKLETRGIRPCPESGKGVHDWIPHAARRLAVAGVDPGEAENWITAHMIRTPSPSNEVVSTIRKIYLEQAQQAASGKRWNHISFEKPEFCANKLKAIAARMDGVDNEWLAARSPVRVDNHTPASFLHALFRKGEKVLVFNLYRSQGQMLWTHPGLIFDERAWINSEPARPMASGFSRTRAMESSAIFLASSVYTIPPEPPAELRKI
jgi:hypothetical protein